MGEGATLLFGQKSILFNGVALYVFLENRPNLKLSMKKGLTGPNFLMTFVRT
jgi:hypothetical protein